MSFDILNNVWPEWKAEELLGKGSYGAVYKAIRRDHNVESSAAIKVILIPSDVSELNTLRMDGLDEDATVTYFQEVVNDFVREIQMMESLKGIQNIVSVEDYKVIEKIDALRWEIYIRMELLTPFTEYIRNKVLTEEDVIRLGCDICTALEVCGKRGIIHRDIKPENIFVNDFGYFKLGDFGIARKLENITGGLSQKGTYNYMAPEIANGRNYDSRVDIYSLGLVLYRLMNNNRLPFIDTEKQLFSPNERRIAVEKRIRGEKLAPPCSASAELADVILRACAHDSAERFASATEMKQALMKISYGMYTIGSTSVDKDAAVPLAAVAEDEFDRTIAAIPVQAEEDELDMTVAAIPAQPEDDELDMTVAAVPIQPEDDELDMTVAAVPTQPEDDELDMTVAAVPAQTEEDELDKTVAAVHINPFTTEAFEYTEQHEPIPKEKKDSAKKNKTIILCAICGAGALILTALLILFFVLLPDKTEEQSKETTDFWQTDPTEKPSSTQSPSSTQKPSSPSNTQGFVFEKYGNEYTISKCDKNNGVVTIPDTYNGSKVTKIDEFAFSSCSNLSKITIPANIKSISPKAFAGCKNLTQIDVSSSNKTYRSEGNCIIEIESDILVAGCKSSVIPNGVTHISEYAFYNCTGLVNVEIPASVENIGKSAFNGCNSLASISFKSFKTHISSENTLPSFTTIHGYSSSTAEEYAAENDRLFINFTPSASGLIAKNIQWEFFEESGTLNILGEGAMPDHYTMSAYVPWDDYRKSIKAVNIGGHITEICNYAFHGTSITEMVIPSSITRIGYASFDSCSYLTSIVIPASVTSIDRNPFSQCWNLSSIEVDSSNPVYHSKYGCLIDTQRKLLIAGCKNSVIPTDGSVTAINDRAFSGISISSVVIPSTVTYIGKNAFWSSTLTSVEIPSSVTHIDNLAFNNCRSLEEIFIYSPNLEISNDYEGTIPTNTVIFGYHNSTAEEYAQSYGNLFVAFEASVEGYFGANNALKWEFFEEIGHLNISGEGAMPDYSSSNDAPWEEYKDDIEVINIINGITHIGQFSFFSTDATNVNMPSSLISIAYGSFAHCTNLTAVTIPANVTSIDPNPFYGCPSLTSIQVDTRNPKFHSQGNCLIETETKTLISGFPSSTIPSDGSVTVIGEYAFESADIDMMDIPYGITKIMHASFFGCRKLTYISIPETVTVIEDEAFKYCEALNSIVIPESVEEIGWMAFDYCQSLSRITFLSTSTDICDDENTIPEYTMIYGYRGSTAEAYAQKYNRTFEPLN